MLNCDIHPEVTFPEGYTCPACQRTDSTVVRILRTLLDLQQRLIRLEKLAALSRPEAEPSVCPRCKSPKVGIRNCVKPSIYHKPFHQAIPTLCEACEDPWHTTPERKEPKP